MKMKMRMKKVMIFNDNFYKKNQGKFIIYNFILFSA